MHRRTCTYRDFLPSIHPGLHSHAERGNERLMRIHEFRDKVGLRYCPRTLRINTGEYLLTHLIIAHLASLLIFLCSEPYNLSGIFGSFPNRVKRLTFDV
jgi:hypothetical protein